MIIRWQQKSDHAEAAHNFLSTSVIAVHFVGAVAPPPPNDDENEDFITIQKLLLRR